MNRPFKSEVSGERRTFGDRYMLPLMILVGVLALGGVAAWLIWSTRNEVRDAKKQLQQESESLKTCRADRDRLTAVTKNAAAPWLPGYYLVCLRRGAEYRKKFCYMFGPAVHGDAEREFILQLEEAKTWGWNYHWDDCPNGLKRMPLPWDWKCLGYWYESYEEPVINPLSP